MAIFTIFAGVVRSSLMNKGFISNLALFNNLFDLLDMFFLVLDEWEWDFVVEWDLVNDFALDAQNLDNALSRIILYCKASEPALTNIIISPIGLCSSIFIVISTATGFQSLGLSKNLERTLNVVS